MLCKYFFMQPDHDIIYLYTLCYEICMLGKHIDVYKCEYMSNNVGNYMIHLYIRNCNEGEKFCTLPVFIYFFVIRRFFFLLLFFVLVCLTQFTDSVGSVDFLQFIPASVTNFTFSVYSSSI